MEEVKILGIDPSLRNTGLAIVKFNTETLQFSVTNCQVLKNPQAFKGKEAILNMIEMMIEESNKECYLEVDQVLIESPSTMFSKTFPSSVLSSISHVAGAAIPIFGVEIAHIYRPNEWNKSRKKQVTHQKTCQYLGSPDQWHYEKRVKAEKDMEHILDAASIALWWIKENYIEEE